MSDSSTTTAHRQAEPENQQSDWPTSALSTARRYLHESVRSGLLPAAATTVSLLGVRRALRDGSPDSAVKRAMVAVFWLGVASVQWGAANRAIGSERGKEAVDQRDVVTTAPDVDSVSSPAASSREGTHIEVSEASAATADAAADVDQSDVVDTEPDLEEVEDAGSETGSDDAEPGEDEADDTPE